MLAALDLLGDDGEHLKLDSVELIEATPGPTRGESLEEFPHDHVVKTVRAVEDDTLSRQGFGQILDGLSLACTGGTLRGAAIVQVDGSAERSVASVSQSGDDQPARVTQVLVVVV